MTPTVTFLWNGPISSCQFGVVLLGALSSLGDDSSAALGLDEQLNTERAIGPTNDGSVWMRRTPEMAGTSTTTTAPARSNWFRGEGSNPYMQDQNLPSYH